MKVKCDICGQEFEKICQDDVFCDKCLYQINLEQAETKDKLVLFLKSEWYDKIEDGRKTHEYRRQSAHWRKRLNRFYKTVEFHRGYTKTKMLFEVADMRLIDGKDTDLHINELVYDIKLGERQV